MPGPGLEAAYITSSHAVASSSVQQMALECVCRPPLLVAPVGTQIFLVYIVLNTWHVCGSISWSELEPASLGYVTGVGGCHCRSGSWGRGHPVELLTQPAAARPQPVLPLQSQSG